MSSSPSRRFGLKKRAPKGPANGIETEEPVSIPFFLQRTVCVMGPAVPDVLLASPE